MSLPREVRVVEVGPRDGLQNEAAIVPTATKIELIDRLSATGLKSIEAGAFVSPKWVPQMADSASVLKGIRRRQGTSYPVLVPNEKGMDGAMAAGANEIAIFAAASESFSRRNINCGIAESLERFRPVTEQAMANGIAVRGYVSCVLGCPYEGEIAPDAVASVATALTKLGCYEVSLGDTIGVGTPEKARRMVERVAIQIPIERLAAHFHDTYGQALANLYAVLESGVRVIDASVAGLGGCPYAPGASGNVATEDVNYMLDGMGISTGVDLGLLADAGQFISRAVGRKSNSRVGLAIAARQSKT